MQLIEKATVVIITHDFAVHANDTVVIKASEAPTVSRSVSVGDTL